MVDFNKAKNSTSGPDFTPGERQHYENLIKKEQQRQQQDKDYVRACRNGAIIGGIGGAAFGALFGNPFIPGIAGGLGGCALNVGAEYLGNQASNIPDNLNTEQRRRDNEGYRSY